METVDSRLGVVDFHEIRSKRCITLESSDDVVHSCDGPLDVVDDERSVVSHGSSDGADSSEAMEAVSNTRRFIQLPDSRDEQRASEEHPRNVGDILQAAGSEKPEKILLRHHGCGWEEKEAKQATLVWSSSREFGAGSPPKE